MLKKFILLLLPFMISLSAFAQTDRKVDQYGTLIYQYNRSARPNPDKPGSLIVTFTFINGNKPNAICLRQEKLNADIQWIDTTNAITATEKIVETITTNLNPNQSASWEYIFTPKRNKSKSGITIEKAALLIMNQQYATEKVILPAKKIL